jgi:4-amino-4-deoxy-L-arabinose transferase-like glycosyltransferase
MSKLQIKKINIGLIIVLLASASYFMWSVTLPFNTGPDEYMRYQIPQFIYEHGSLPHGGDPTIRNEIWGFSYGFTPILSYIISALFMKIMSIFSQNDFALLIAARFTSVLWSAGTVLMCCKIGKKLFSKRLQYLLAIFVGFLPQFIFISSYVNNDSMAVFSTSLIIYFWIVGLESKWNFRSCIGLAVGISLCALSYYNAYGYILCSILLFIFSFVYQYRQSKSGWLICNKLIKKGV